MEASLPVICKNLLHLEVRLLRHVPNRAEEAGGKAICVALTAPYATSGHSEFLTKTPSCGKEYRTDFRHVGAKQGVVRPLRGCRASPRRYPRCSGGGHRPP